MRIRVLVRVCLHSRVRHAKTVVAALKSWTFSGPRVQQQWRRYYIAILLLLCVYAYCSDAADSTLLKLHRNWTD